MSKYSDIFEYLTYRESKHSGMLAFTVCKAILKAQEKKQSQATESVFVIAVAVISYVPIYKDVEPPFGSSGY
ncbi:unnamed protein product [Strongylus vulgaris]|uniref:Uncharacterized protein n=1 Tax=Strongylus vulgaris TaxID=40348 RepID=A0A3P7KR83_STRVU|nr:unnamed protein product [Strongylus vulgaris]